MESKKIIVILALILVLGMMAGCRATVPVKVEEAEDRLEALAKCLSKKGAKLYGAYWCGWCNRQKEIFGEAAQHLPYIECSDRETRQMTPQCREAGITGLPTWEFEGQKSSGFKSLEELARLSGCSF